MEHGSNTGFSWLLRLFTTTFGGFTLHLRRDPTQSRGTPPQPRAGRSFILCLKPLVDMALVFTRQASFFFSFQEISNETVTLYRGFLWVPVVPTGARGNSRAKPRKTVDSVNDCHGFIWVPAFPVGVTRLSLGGPLYDILPVAQRTDSFTIKALVRWATGKRFTNRLPKLSLTTLSPPRTAGYSGLDRK